MISFVTRVVSSILQKNDPCQWFIMSQRSLLSDSEEMESEASSADSDSKDDYLKAGKPADRTDLRGKFSKKRKSANF